MAQRPKVNNLGHGIGDSNSHTMNYVMAVKIHQLRRMVSYIDILLFYLIIFILIFPYFSFSLL